MVYMAIPFPAIDPVAIGLGPVHVRWYGLAYLAGLVLGWLYMRRLLGSPALWSNQQPPMKPAQADDFLLWATLGTVIGGRLGFVLLYEPSTFLHDPLRVFSVWEGGMAFHGGFLGVTLAIILFARVNRIPLLSLGDLAAAVVPFGLFFGRIANFINGEVYGRITDVPWAVVFPAHVLDQGSGHIVGPRHPTQFYEAFLEGLVLFLVIRYFTHKREALKQPGLCAGVFLSGYALARIFVEFFKEWDYGQFFTTEYFSTGMVYSIPMLIAGGILIGYGTRKQVPTAA
ncbi:MAG TPA: prolipoprotein diacylglyceryl transferase [Hyphomicrobiales bacterium]|nr:prolipoprotein diacylglyceryl transferase [Hyphomicrobiales bacterium]